jgi:hypothetical protein
MTLLQPMLDGALAAAELLALLFVSPAAAREPAAVEAPATIERSVQLHRLSTAVDIRLLGSLADVRVAQAVRNASFTTADLAPQLPAVDEHVDGLRIVHGTHAVDLLPACGGDDLPIAGHARLTDDERIADALRLAPGSHAVIETTAAQPLLRSGRSYRVMLPVRVEADAPRAMLVDEDNGAFLLIVPARAAPRGTLVLRPASGEPETLQLGAIDTRHAVLVPLPGRADLDRLADGAVEFELTDDRGTWWTTLVAERVGERPALQTRSAE